MTEQTGKFIMLSMGMITIFTGAFMWGYDLINPIGGIISAFGGAMILYASDNQQSK